MYIEVNDLRKNSYSVLSAYGWEEQIKKIIFYDDNGVIFSKSRSWEASEKDKASKESERVYMRELERICLSNLRSARIKDLTKRDNFTIKHEREDYERARDCEGVKDLYIYCGVGGDCSIIAADEVLSMEAHGKKDYIMQYEISFNRGYIGNYAHVVDIFGVDNYQLKDGEQFSSDYGTKEAPTIEYIKERESLFNNKKIEAHYIRQWKEKEHRTSALIVRGDYITRSEKNAEREQREQIAALLNSKLSSHKQLNHYDIEDILKVVNITIKEGE